MPADLRSTASALKSEPFALKATALDLKTETIDLKTKASDLKTKAFAVEHRALAGGFSTPSNRVKLIPLSKMSVPQCSTAHCPIGMVAQTTRPAHWPAVIDLPGPRTDECVGDDGESGIRGVAAHMIIRQTHCDTRPCAPRAAGGARHASSQRDGNNPSTAPQPPEKILAANHPSATKRQCAHHSTKTTNPTERKRNSPSHPLCDRGKSLGV